ncbi:hypothetical protein K745_gp01 [Haloarcula hispanica virus PH1]|uniref:Uncharacterized protein n=1 Tax=Haloarcula hispanica virus PH1 TaxID=1282967 RepID=M4JFL3_9VIRU|nr:hypothetical protein K745_gp01 [Haloarcula hispanica virus PH1]AGC65526.1 hypothetical protein HhPH1_gp01 [Haloarcula hispanica virus PH1]
MRPAVPFPLREDADPSPTRSNGRGEAADSRATRRCDGESLADALTTEWPAVADD